MLDTSFYIILLLISFAVSYSLYYLPCFSSFCSNNSGLYIALELTLLIIYLILVGVYNRLYKFIPKYTKALLSSESQPFKQFRCKFNLNNTHFPKITIIDVIHLYIISLLAIGAFFIWHYPLVNIKLI
jgi:hypothetical protein